MTYIYIEREGESNHGEKNYILEKYFRLTQVFINSLYLRCIYHRGWKYNHKSTNDKILLNWIKTLSLQRFVAPGT